MEDVKPGERKCASFVVKNKGCRPLEFDVRTSCGCTAVSPFKGIVPANGQQEIRLVVEVPEYAGSERAVTVAITSNDPRRPAAVCRIVATCPAPLIINPTFVDFGELTAQEAMQATKTLCVRLPPSSLQPIQTVGNTGAFSIDIKPLDAHQSALSVRIAKSLPVGEHVGRIGLRASGADAIVTVPIRVEIVQPITVAPVVVYLYKDPRTSKFRDVDVIVWSRCKGVTLGALTGFDTPSGVSCRVVGDATLGRKVVRVSYVATENCCSPQGSLTLHFEGVKNPIVCDLILCGIR